MDSKQRLLLEIALRELCEIQDEITHMNENAYFGVELQEKQAVRKKLMSQIIDQVDKWTRPNGAREMHSRVGLWKEPR